MINKDLKLEILHDDNSSFLDYSYQAVDFDRGTFGATLVAAEDYLYIGYYKPLSAVYVYMDTASTTDTTLTSEYYNGTTWASISGIYDETDGLQRSGFVRWDRNLTDEEEVAVNSTTKFWYRFKPGADTTAITFKAINIIFSDDQDLKRELFEYQEFLPTGQSDFTLQHVAARDEIIQSIRNNGRFKQNQNTGRFKNINAFDVLNINELNKAATYKVLANIMANVMNDPDGLYRQKNTYYQGKYHEAMDLFYLSLDQDDDGVSDISEELRSYSGSIIRR